MDKLAASVPDSGGVYFALPALHNLARAGQLKTEARNDAEVGRLLAMARTRLADADARTDQVSRVSLQNSVSGS